MEKTKQTKKVLEELFKELGNKRIDLGDYRFLKKKYLGERIHFLDKDKRYLCIKACGITKGKYTKDKKKVTCKNCLRKLKKEVRNSHPTT
ncbi:MAG: hypothetical protein ACTSPI_01395 [Candidatus Heimdallarchaeaceae archaeon]